MKVYMIGPTVDAYSYDATEFLMFRTINIHGKAYYSTAFILEALFARALYARSGDDLSSLWFISMEHVKNTMAARHWEGKDTEPTSGVKFNNPTHYDGPDYTHIIYELEIPSDMEQSFNTLPSNDDNRRHIPGKEHKKHEYKLNEAQHMVFLQSSTLISANIAGTIYQLNTSYVDYEPLLFQDFMLEYRKQYSSEWFTNPWSKMNRLINSGQINNMLDVYSHAFKFPHSRTAMVLKNMINDPALLSNHIIEDKISNGLDAISAELGRPLSHQ